MQNAECRNKKTADSRFRGYGGGEYARGMEYVTPANAGVYCSYSAIDSPRRSYTFLHYALCIIICLICTSRAQHPDAGTTAFPFLNLGYEARSAAMGGASAAMPNEVYGILSNPASIGYVNKTQIMAGYRQIIMDIRGGPLGVVYPTSKGIFAANLIALTTGEFDIVNENGIATKDRARSSYTTGGVSWAMLLYENLSAGITLKAVYHNLEAGAERYSADGFALDCGVQYRLYNGRLIYGAVLRNFGFVRSGYLNEFNDYPFPYGVEAGISYVPRHVSNFRVALDVNKMKGDYLNFEPGFEYTLFSNVFLRGGYTFSFKDLEKTLEVFRGERDENHRKTNMNTLSLGGGMTAQMDNVDLKLDAAFQFYSDISRPSLILSVTAAF
ncbi:MAG: PorV/PorQ family protein [Chitinispirillales bacterium]|jgi:hypothetical protein|nr:PorV/PorQ family protein [Chitinispirillales bacterium]